jgi:hypothetical protein
MSIGFLFWLIMILWLIFGFYWGYSQGTGMAPMFYGNHFVLWVLLALLGWKAFGFPIHGGP